MLLWPYDLPHRGVGVGAKQAENFGEFLARMARGNRRRAVRVRAREQFSVVPLAHRGGRTNHWEDRAAVCPGGFRSKTRDGLGDDWPISYDDIAPYYDKVESYIGVFGSHENVDSAPNGVFSAAPGSRAAMSAGQAGLRQAEYRGVFRRVWRF